MKTMKQMNVNKNKYGTVLEIYHNHPLSYPPSGYDGKTNNGKSDKNALKAKIELLGYSFFQAYVYKPQNQTLTPYYINHYGKEFPFESLNIPKGKIASQSPSWLYRIRRFLCF